MIEDIVEKLLCCPCCGLMPHYHSELSVDPVIDPETGAYIDADVTYLEWVECDCGLCTGLYEDEGEALKRWNRRTYTPIPLSMYIPNPDEEFVIYGKKGGTSLARYLMDTDNGDYRVFRCKNQKSNSLHILKENPEDVYIIPLKRFNKEEMKELYEELYKEEQN